MSLATVSQMYQQQKQTFFKNIVILLLVLDPRTVSSLFSPRAMFSLATRHAFGAAFTPSVCRMRALRAVAAASGKAAGAKKRQQQPQQQGRQQPGELDLGSWESASDDGPTLVIVESPAKARTIQKFVDTDRFIIDFCAGHVRDLPKAGADFENKRALKQNIVLPELKLNVADLGVDVMNNFEPVYVTLDNKVEVVRRLKKLSEQCSRILLATDEDREGEAISWHLVELLQPKVPYKRAVFHEITKSAILHSFETPRDIDMNLVESQETRRILDRLAGYTVSPVLWRYVSAGLSAGRVQSCGLHLISQREKKRWQFSEAQYFSIKAAFTDDPAAAAAADPAAAGRRLVSKLHMLDDRRVAGEGDFDGTTGELKSASEADKAPLVLDKDSAQAIMLWLAGRPSFDEDAAAAKPPDFVVTNVDTRKSSRKQPAAFITSTLQQECSRKLRMSPSRCMSIAQELYEEGWITYMRTDSPALSDTAYGVARTLVNKIFGDDYLGDARKAAAAGGAPVAADAEAAEGATKGTKKGKKGAEKEGSDAAGADAGAGPASPKNAQLAHEAIRPAEVDGTFKTPAQTGLDGQKRLLYSLIYRRTLASVMKPSQALTKTYTIETSGASSNAPPHSRAHFRASETVTTFKGHLAAMAMGDAGQFAGDDEDPLNKLYNWPVGQALFLAEWQQNTPAADSGGGEGEGEVDAASVFGPDADASATSTTDEAGDAAAAGDGDEVAASALQLGGLSAVQHVTRPPSRFSEASFIKELETVGVGRPSTYSKIFQILKEREYVYVDKQTLIPTVKGMVVAEWLERHFGDLVDAQFTAHMEESLDKISRGEKDKLSFLSDFYLGGPDKEHSGLLSRVAQKLANQEIDHKESRTLEVPFLSDLGVLQLGRSGAFIERKAAPGEATEPAASGAEDATTTTTTNAADGGGNAGARSGLRWKLPEAMQIDLRQITREAVEYLMATEQTMQGTALGTDPATGRPITMRSGRFGKYLQVGLDAEKNKTTHSVPQSLSPDDLSFEDILAFTRLPLPICPHPTLNASIIAEVAGRGLCVGVDGYPLRVPVPPHITTVAGITPEVAAELLADATAVMDSRRGLGEWRNESVAILKGRFGYYLKCGKLVAGLRKLDPAEVTLEAAIQILESRGKPVGSRKKGGAGKGGKKKTAAMKEQMSMTRSGYQIYVGKAMKEQGMKMGEAAAAWKTLSPEEQEVYKAEARAFVPGPEDGKQGVAIRKKKSKSATAAPITGYQLFLKESKQRGGWKLLDAAQQLQYKERAAAAASTAAGTTTPSITAAAAQGVQAKKAPANAYQHFVSLQMKSGHTMAEAARAWKDLDAREKERLKATLATTVREVADV